MSNSPVLIPAASCLHTNQRIPAKPADEVRSCTAAFFVAYAGGGINGTISLRRTRKQCGGSPSNNHIRAAIDRNAAGTKALAYCWLFHLVGDLHQPQVVLPAKQVIPQPVEVLTSSERDRVSATVAVRELIDRESTVERSGFLRPR